MSTLINITSKEQFSSLLTSSAIVVADCESWPALQPLFSLRCPSSRIRATIILCFDLDTDYYSCLVYADWCGPCKAIAPAYEQLALQLTRPNRITFTKINVDQQQDIAKTYGVTAYVTEINNQRKEGTY